MDSIWFRFKNRKKIGLIESCEKGGEYNAGSFEALYNQLCQEPPSIGKKLRLRALKALAHQLEQKISVLEREGNYSELKNLITDNPVESLFKTPYLKMFKGILGTDLPATAANAYRRIILDRLLPEGSDDRELLEEYINDPDFEVRQKASRLYEALALPDINQISDLDDLRPYFLKSISAVAEQARERAGVIIERMKDDDRIEELVKLLDDKDKSLADQASSVLWEISTHCPEQLIRVADLFLDRGGGPGCVELIHRFCKRTDRGELEFFQERMRPQIKEFMEAPLTNIYGSLPTVWIFRDKQREIRRIMLTGHAYPSICAKVSRIAMQFFSEFALESSSYLLAGAVRCDFKNREIGSKEGMDHDHLTRFEDRVKKYLESLSDLQKDKYGWLFDFAVSRAKVGMDTNHTKGQLIGELDRVAKECGLVCINDNQSFENHQALEAGVFKAAASGSSLNSEESSPAVVPFMNSESDALTIEVPLEIFGAERFLKLWQTYLEVARRELTEDIKRRNRFYEQTLGKWSYGFNEYFHKELDNPLGFNSEEVKYTESVDLSRAEITKYAEPVVKSAREHLNSLPTAIIDTLWWQAKMDTLHEEVEKEYKHELPLHVLSSLLDALIRGWDLPLPDPELDRHRREWKENNRSGSLFLLERALHRKGIDLNDLKMEGTIFPVTACRDGIVWIMPRYIYDPKWAVGGKVFGSHWDGRQVTFEEQAKAANLAVEHIRNGMLAEAVKIDGGALANNVVNIWIGLLVEEKSETFNDSLELMINKVKNLEGKSLYNQAVDEFNKIGHGPKEVISFIIGYLEQLIQNHQDVPDLKILRVKLCVELLNPVLKITSSRDEFWDFIKEAAKNSNVFHDRMAMISNLPGLEKMLKQYLGNASDKIEEVKYHAARDMICLKSIHSDYLYNCISKRGVVPSMGGIRERIEGNVLPEERAFYYLVRGQLLEIQAIAVLAAIRLLEEKKEIKVVVEHLMQELNLWQNEYYEEIREFNLKEKKAGARASDRFHGFFKNILENIVTDAFQSARLSDIHSAANCEALVLHARLAWNYGEFRKALSIIMGMKTDEADGRISLTLAASIAGGKITVLNEIAMDNPPSPLTVEENQEVIILSRAASNTGVIAVEGLEPKDRKHLIEYFQSESGRAVLQSPKISSFPSYEYWAGRLPVTGLGKLAGIQEPMSAERSMFETCAIYFGINAFEYFPRRKMAGDVIVNIMTGLEDKEDE